MISFFGLLIIFSRYIIIMIVHLIDGTYELFRHFYGLRSFNKGRDKQYGAVVGVLKGILQMLEEGATHLGVATDHVIESFRNNLWAGYKTGFGIDPVLYNQFHPLEEALQSMGVDVWPMIELEADDGLASAAYIASADQQVEKVCIWTPDKDLAQCVRGERVVQMDRRSKAIMDEDAVTKKYGVNPKLIPDFLALTGDSADGYPGIPGIGKTGAARLLNRYGPIELFPEDLLKGQLEKALLFKRLATLRTDAKLFTDIAALQWEGPGASFSAMAVKLGEPGLAERAKKVAEKSSKGGLFNFSQ
jgi:5'-3' exonuclease